MKNYKNIYLLIKNNKFNLALNELNKIKKEECNSFEYNYLKGFSFLNLNKINDAIENLSSAIKIDQLVCPLVPCTGTYRTSTVLSTGTYEYYYYKGFLFITASMLGFLFITSLPQKPKIEILSSNFIISPDRLSHDLISFISSVRIGNKAKLFFPDAKKRYINTGKTKSTISTKYFLVLLLNTGV